MKTDMTYTIGEVEKMLDIPRTTIRHYLDKGLLNLKRDKNSSYYRYTFKDLVRICQIVYYREILGFSIEDVQNILETSSVEYIEKIINAQSKNLNYELSEKQRQLNMLRFNQEMIEKQHKFRDKLTLLPFDKAYALSYKNYFTPNFELYPILYGASEFHFDGEKIDFVKNISLVFEKDAKHIGEEKFFKEVEGLHEIELPMGVYTVKLTKGDFDNPALLRDPIKWATKHRFRVNGPIYMTHFFPYYAKDNSYKYIEIYLPIDIL